MKTMTIKGVKWFRTIKIESRTFKMPKKKSKGSWISSPSREEWLKGKTLGLLIILIFNTKKSSSIFIGRRRKSKTWTTKMLSSTENRLGISKSGVEKFSTLSSTGTSADCRTSYSLSSKKDNIPNLSPFRPKLFHSSCQVEMLSVLLKLALEKLFLISYPLWNMSWLRDLLKKDKDPSLSLWHQHDNWLVKCTLKLKILLNQHLSE